jgi:HD-GYP domain-containing protein (c-di-GMP phosphodiesterase class II)
MRQPPVESAGQYTTVLPLDGGEEIPFIARLFAVIDTWDALNSDRPYRKAWKRADVLVYLRENAGKKFDPSIVQAFLGLIQAQPGA